MAGYSNSGVGMANDGQNRGFFNKALRRLSNWGQDYEDLTLQNAVSFGLNQIPTAGSTNGSASATAMYDLFSSKASKILETKAISYLDKTYPEKIRVLTEYSRKDEIQDMVRQVADETIIYDDNGTADFCTPTPLSEEFNDTLKTSYLDTFKKIYNRAGFKDGSVAWRFFRKFLITGFLAFEIVYDDKFRNIVGFQQIQSETLLPSIDPNTGDRIWIQYPDNPELRKFLLDCQIIYISYASGDEFGEMSYVESLIRPYNQLKLLEETRIMFNIKAAMTYKKFTIPVGGISQSLAEMQVQKLISDYKEEISFNQDSGLPMINGQANIPYTKEYWFPEGEGGTPGVELVAQQGDNLNENDMLTWFYNNLKRASKIPFNRFDKTNGGGNIFGDTSEVSRDELSFFYYISRLRTVFKEIIVKPWKLQLLLDFPEMRNDENFLADINVEFNGVNMFHEWKHLGNLQKRADIAGGLSSSIQETFMDENGQPQQQPYFHTEFLVRKVIKMSEEDLKENARWKKYSLGGTIAGGGGAGGGGGGGAPDMGGSPDMGGMDAGGDASMPAPDAAPADTAPADAAPADDAGADF